MANHRRALHTKPDNLTDQQWRLYDQGNKNLEALAWVIPTLWLVLGIALLFFALAGYPVVWAIGAGVALLGVLK